MKLELEFGSALCYCPLFRINGIDAEERDFGSGSDESPDTAEDYCCGNRVFRGMPSTPELLSKYKITEAEYKEVVSQLEKGLSFGRCGWCQ